jgi:hypothetical protein
VSAFDDWFAKNMPDAEWWFQQFAAEPVAARPNVEPMGEPFSAPEPSRGGFLVPPGLLNAAYIEVSNELLMDCGVIPDTRERRPIPWRWRAKSKIREWRESAARVAYRAIAGQWPDNGEDDW